MKGRLIKRESNYYLFVEGKPFGTTDDLYLQYEIVNKLSKQNCDEIFGVVDVEKLAEDFAKNYSIYPTAQDDTEYGFKNGFNKAMELNKDKVFTLEDMKRAIDKAKQGSVKETHNGYGRPTEPRFVLDDLSYGEIIQSLQPTEIEVEIECHTIKQTKVYGAIKGVKGSGHKITTTGYAPKLDDNNNLILRRI
jgi:hypothetical protein